MPDFSTRPRPRRAHAWEGILLAVGFGTLAASAYDASSAWAERGAARAAAAAARGEAARLGEKLAALEAPNGADELAGKILLTAEAPPPRVLAELTELMSPAVRLEDLTLSYGKALEVSARVSAREASAYDAFLRRLGASPAFAQVAPGAENRDGEVRASLRMVYRGGAP